jgi:hypothetical protein
VGKMKKLLLGVAAIGLSGCSWLGLGGQHASHTQTAAQYGSYYNQAQKVSQGHTGQLTQLGHGAHQGNNTLQNQTASWGQSHHAAAGQNYGANWRQTQPVSHRQADSFQHSPVSNHSGAQHFAAAPRKGCCVGGKTLSRWNIEAGVGPEFFIGGDAISGDQINDIDGVTSQARSFKDVYDPGIRYDLGTSYALNPNRKVTANVFYANADGEETTLGNINGEDVTGRIGDYERYGAEIGLRQYARPVGVPLLNSVRPYVEGKIGAARINDIDFVNSDPNATALAGTTPFYEGGWVPTGAGLIGLETPVFDRFTMGVETGLRYTGVPASDTSVLSSGVPLAGTNNGGANWSVPLQIRGRYRF